MERGSYEDFLPEKWKTLFLSVHFYFYPSISPCTTLVSLPSDPDWTLLVLRVFPTGVFLFFPSRLRGLSLFSFPASISASRSKLSLS